MNDTGKSTIFSIIFRNIFDCNHRLYISRVHPPWQSSWHTFSAEKNSDYNKWTSCSVEKYASMSNFSFEKWKSIVWFTGKEYTTV